MIENEELERICFNCNYFFPASMDEHSEDGICLNDNIFQPFLDDLLDNCNYDCCKDLIERKKFKGDHDVCSEFSEIDMEGCIEIDDNSDLGQKILASIRKGDLDKETFENAIIEEYNRVIDFKTLPIDKYVKELESNNYKTRNSAISTLGSLSLQDNESAFQELFKFLKKLPSPETIEEVHLSINILNHLSRSEFRASLTHYLLDELYKTPSNNTTRQWISAILKSLKWCPYVDVNESLERMLGEKRFSYRLKQKIKNILYELEYNS